MKSKAITAGAALALLLLVGGPPTVGGISKPKGGQSAGRWRKVTRPEVVS